MKLLLMLTARCNASCGHCSTNCGPRRKERLPRDKLLGLMDEAAALSAGEPLVFALSGGEPFLDIDLLVDVIRHGTALGADKITCMTNAYWATSDARAVDLLNRIKAAGLGSLGISVSRFHEPFVKRTRVATALRAARSAGLPCGVKYVRSQSDAGRDDEVTAWARRNGAGEVEIVPLMPALRNGVRMPDTEYLRFPGVPQGPCPAPVITIREHGEAFMCGAPGADRPLLSLGNVHSASLEDIRDRHSLGGVPRALRLLGPAHLARAVAQGGQAGRLRPRYAGVCDLCVHIAGDPVMAPLAQAAGAALEIQLCEQLLERLGGRPSRESTLARRRPAAPPASASRP
jgi:hypothetical protein